MPSTDELPLPYGWIKDFDPNTNRHFYVDTKATPPRSIWVHPYNDEQYLKEHPEVKEKIHPQASEELSPEAPRRHSYHGHTSHSPLPSNQEASSSSKKRGFFGKLKDKAIGTKEEREAEKRRLAMLREQYRQQRMATQAMYGNYAQHGQSYQQPYLLQQYGTPYGRPSRFGGGRGSGGGMALPLIGGLAGGLILGDLLDNSFDDFGGDDFGGF